MNKRIKKVVPTAPEYPKVVETYSVPWDIDRVRLDRPSCFNGIVQVERYRITVEKVEESRDVIRDRLVTLWRTSESNWHHVDPMRRAAMRLLGISSTEASDLFKSAEHGVDFKRREAK